MPKKEIWAPVWSADAKAWLVDFRAGGKRVRRRLPIHDESLRKEAYARARELYRTAWSGPVSARGNQKKPLTFKEAARLYEEQGGEARFLPRLVAFFGPSTLVEDIDHAMMARAARALYPHARPDTIRRQLRVPVNAVKNFAAGKRRQKLVDNARVRWLTPEEAERLLEAAADPASIGLRDPNLETLRKIAFMLGTGAAPGETMALTAEGWNPATREWWLPGKKTVYRARFVKLPSRTVELIGRIPTEGPAFPAPNGQPYKFTKNRGGQMAAAFRKVRDAAGLPKDISPYSLRHTWATWHYSMCKDWGRLLDEGGWNRSDTANRYRKIAPSDLPERLLAHGWEFREEDGRPVCFGEFVSVRRR